MSKQREKKPGKRWKKTLLVISLVVAGLIAVTILAISPITKYLVEKYDVKYTGREIRLGNAYVNPFSGFVHFTSVRIYEQNSDSIFLSADGISLNFSLLKLFSRTFELRSVALDRPRGIVIQDSSHLNFSDVIEKFTPNDKNKVSTNPFHFNILNITVSDGEFIYSEKLIPIYYSIRKVYFNSTGKSWDSDTINVKFSFIPGAGGGDASGAFTVNFKTQDYRLGMVAHKLDLGILEQYLKDLVNYGTFSANLDANVKAKGNFRNIKRLNLKGKIAVNDFHLGKDPDEDYMSFEKLAVGIRELDPGNEKFFFDSITLTSPFLKYERYDSLDNIQRMFGKDGQRVKAASSDPAKFNLVIEILNYIWIVFRNILQSDYKFSSLAVKNGDIKFYDYSIRETFAAALHPFNLKADSVDNSKKRVKVILESSVLPFGSISATGSMDPKDEKNFTFTYKIQNIPATVFNPYLITFTSFPLDRGVIDVYGTWNIHDDVIQSTNHFVAIDPRVSKRIRKKDTKWIPLPLIMSLVRERGNVIDYHIPITGSLKDPNFHFHDVLMDLIENIFVKPATTAYRHEVKVTEDEIERSLSLKWPMRQAKLDKTQKKFLEKIAKFLKDHPDANLTLHPFTHAEKEKEHILFFEAKKKYFYSRGNQYRSPMNEEDSLSIDKISSKDASFVKYLDHKVTDTMLFTRQGKCYRLVGETVVNQKYDQLLKGREQAVVDCFKEQGTDRQVRFHANTSTVPFNSFSYLKIEYSGIVPESLKLAYNKLYDLNSETPRSNYYKFRKGKAEPVIH